VIVSANHTISAIFKQKEDALIQNFPNPFNPETWIPFEIKENCEVNIRIYNSTGRLVRALNLGSKSAGLYASIDKAAYWDGKDESGVPVASGIYFYSIQAGKFTAVKKMIVSK
jgi:flagellar hook assembly protein FlgD